jgi:cytoskeleton protein RodZ
MARRFRDLTGTAAVKPRLVFPEPVPDRGMPAGLMIGVGAMIAVGAYVAWFNWAGGGSRSVDVVPPVPPRLEAAAEQGRAQLPARDGASSGTLPLAALPPPGGTGANTSAQAATVPSAPVPAAFQASAPSATPAAATPAAASAAPMMADPAAMPDGTRIVLRARPTGVDGAWVQVRDPRSGQVLLNRVLRPGETWPVPARAGLLLDTGKATELDILLDGQPQPTLEGVIGVRRNIALDPDRVRQRLIPAAAIPAPPPPAPGRG